MATAKTPKKTPAAAPAAAKSAAAKPVAAAPRAPAPKKAAPVARAAEAKPAEDAVVKSAEIVHQQAEKQVEDVAKAAETVAQTVTAAATKTADYAAPEMAKAAEQAVEIAAKPEKAVAVARKAVEKTQAGVAEGMTPFLDYGRESAILLVSTGNQFALGLHKLSLSLLDWSAESCDKGVAAGQAMLSAKTVEEVVDLSRSLAQDSLQQLLKESAELNALSTKLIEDTIVPLPARMADAAFKLASHAA